MSERLLTCLAKEAQDNDLPRILCAGCQGYGSAPESRDCAYCAGSPSGLCVQHRCDHCFGRGVVCPECRGQRFLTRGVGQMRQLTATREHATMVNTALAACKHCMEQTPDRGMRLNLTKELETIGLYIRDPHTAYWEMRHQADAERAAYDELMRETKPWRRSWSSPRSAATAERKAMEVESELSRVTEKILPKLILPPQGVRTYA